MSNKPSIECAYAHYGKKGLVTMTILVLLFSTLCFAPVTVSACPKHDSKTIQIGVIAPWGILGTSEEEWGYDYFDFDTDLFKQLVEPEINNYLANLKTHPGIQIEFLVKSAGEGSPEEHLTALQEFHEMGIDLIIGGYYSGQAAASLAYIKAHNMLLISPSSTDPTLALKDNLFRLVPDDIGLGKPIAATLNERGITKLVVIYSDNNWAAGVINTLDAEYDGDMTSRVPYPEEIDWNYDDPDYTPYLASADAMLSGGPDEGVLLLSYQAQVVLQQAAGYPNVYEVEWFGADATALNSYIRDDAGVEATHVGLYSSIAGIDSGTLGTDRYQAMATQFSALFADTFGFYPACEVDAAWILALSIVRTQNGNHPVNANTVANVLPNVASKYHGYSGLCKLNKYGDRISGTYDIWGYMSGYYLFGRYDTASDTLTWIG